MPPAVTVAELTADLAEKLLAIATWDARRALGEQRFVTVDTTVGGEPLYVQFLSEAWVETLLFEVSSGAFGGPGTQHVATPAERAGMHARGFDGGVEGNFSKASPFLGREDADAIAAEAFAVLVDAFGWRPESAVEVAVNGVRAADEAGVLRSLRASDLEELVRGHSVAVRRMEPHDDDAPRFEMLCDGLRSEVTAAGRTDEGQQRYGRIELRATLPLTAPAETAVRLNAAAPFGRVWLDGDQPVLGMEITLGGGVTEDHLRERLDEWARFVVAIRTSLDELATSHSTQLGPAAFTAAFQEVFRLVSGRVRRGHATAATMDVFRKHASGPLPIDEVEERAAAYVAEHPEHARVLSASYPSGASVEELRAWCGEVHGLELEDMGGELVVRHTVPFATLRLDPRAVRACTVRARAHAFSVEVTRAGHPAVWIGPAEVVFHVPDAPLVVDGVLFRSAPESAALWSAVDDQLQGARRALIAGEDVVALSQRLAFVHAVLVGAEMSSIECGRERARLDRYVARFAERWRAARGLALA